MIELNGVRYAVSDSGEGKENVLLLHGMPDDSTFWQHQIAALLKDGYRVIYLDMLGYGLTDKPQEVERYRLRAIVEDVVSLLDYLDLDQVHCIGHDWGALTGWELAIAAPQRLKSYVAMTVGHPLAWFEDSFQFEKMRWNWYTLFHLTPGAADAYREGNGKLMREVLRSHPDREQVIERYLQPGAWEVIFNWDKANSITDAVIACASGAFDELPPVTVPTFGIWAANDDFMWESQMKNSSQFVTATWRYERIENAGHWFPLEQPKITNQLLLDWLANN